MTENPYAAGASRIPSGAAERDMPPLGPLGSSWRAAWRGARTGGIVGAAISLVPALVLTSFGLGSGHGWDIPIFYFYGIGVFVFLGVLGGLLAALLGLIGALIRIASRWPGRASTAVGAERSTHALPIGQATAGPRDTMTPRNRPVLWPWFTAIPTLLLLAAALIAGAYTGRIVDSESAAAIKAADSDDPYWRWDDLLAHREQLPDAENAAIVMDEVLSLLPEWWLRGNRALAGEQGTRLGQVNQDFARLEATPANLRLRDSVAGSFRDQLEPYERAVKLARSLDGYRRGRRDVERERVVLESPLPQTVESRVVGRLLAIDASMRTHEGDADGALQSCRAMFGVGRSIGDEPFLYAQLVRFALGELALRSTRRVLGQSEPSDESLARVQAAILDELAQPSLLIGLRGERAALTERIRMVGAGEASVSALRDSFNSKTNPRILPHPRAPWRGLWFEHQHATILARMNQAVAIARRPPAEQPPLWEAWEANARRIKQLRFGKFITMLPILFAPAVASGGKGFSRYQSALGAMAVLIAAERQRRKTGTWPASVAAINRDILPIAPIDPFSGQAFRMEHRDGQLFVYSIGPNQKDEHGAFEESGRTGIRDDVGTSAWDVSSRRRSAKGAAE
jgi:hypothetical protein